MTRNITTPQEPVREPSPDVLDFLKEVEMRKFGPDQRVSATIRRQEDLVFVDVWSHTGRHILTSENSLAQVLYLEEQIKDPQRRAAILNLIPGNLKA